MSIYIKYYFGKTELRIYNNKKNVKRKLSCKLLLCFFWYLKMCFLNEEKDVFNKTNWLERKKLKKEKKRRSFPHLRLACSTSTSYVVAKENSNRILNENAIEKECH